MTRARALMASGAAVQLRDSIRTVPWVNRGEEAELRLLWGRIRADLLALARYYAPTPATNEEEAVRKLVAAGRMPEHRERQFRDLVDIRESTNVQFLYADHALGLAQELASWLCRRRREIIE